MPAVNCARAPAPISSCGRDVRLLLTRPEPDAERTATALRARGHTVIVAPLLRIEPVADSEIAGGRFAAILVTSANAAKAIAYHKWIAELRMLPVFAVGQRSAWAMREAGFTDVMSADGDANDLARLVAGRLQPAEPLLYLAAADRAGDLVGALAARNFDVRTVVVYCAVAVSEFPPVAAAALTSGIDGVLHFSRRSAEAYVHAAHGAGLDKQAFSAPVHFCLSAQVAEPLAKAGATDIRIASERTEAALLALVPAA